MEIIAKRKNKTNKKFFFSSLLFFIISITSFSQNSNGEEILRHFDKGEKLARHIYDQDSLAWGYIFGHCRYFDYEWAEKYYIDGSGLVIGAIAHIYGNNSSPEKTTRFSVYNVHKDMKPDRYSYTKTLTYDELNLDGSETRVMFDSSVYVKDSFFIAFAVADYAHDPDILGKDTICLLATEDGTRPDDDLKVFGRNCIRTHTMIPELAWIDAYVSEKDRKSVNAFLAIFPIMDFSSSTENTGISHGNISLFKGSYNPIKSSIEVEVQTKKATEIKIDLLTMDGKKVSTGQFQVEPQQKNNVQLNLGQKINQGYYLLIATEKTNKFAQKILIY